MTARHDYPCQSSNCIACLRAALRDLLGETPWQPQAGCGCSHCIVVERARRFVYGEDSERERLFEESR